MFQGLLSLLMHVSGPLVITDACFRAPQPVYYLVQEPPEGHPEFIVAEIELPKVVCVAGLLSREWFVDAYVLG